MKTFILPLLLTALLASTLARDQSVRISGRFMCHGQPEQFAELKLVNWRALSSNVEMDKDKFTDPSGFFEISGSVNQKFDANPWIYVWHKCYEKPFENTDPCWRHLQIQVPKVHVQEGVLPDRTWNLGEIPLELAQHKSDSCP